MLYQLGSKLISPHSQEQGLYDVAARHGVGPWKQGLLCGLLAAWDIFVDSHTFDTPPTLDNPEVVLGRGYVARARSLHKVLEALRDAWSEDSVLPPKEQIRPSSDVDMAGVVHGNLVPQGMPPFPATQLGLPFPRTQADEPERVLPEDDGPGIEALQSLPAFECAEESMPEGVAVKSPATACSLSTGFGPGGDSVQPVESGQAILLPDREICQITVLVGRPVVTWPMVQGRLRKTVQCDGRKIRAGVSKRQWEAVMKAGMQAFPIAAVRDEGKDTKVEFFAPPKQSDGRARSVCYHNLLMDCCQVTGRHFRQLLAVDAQQPAGSKRKRQ